MAYITVEEVRAEGLTEAMADDDRVELLIERWQTWVDQRCGRWFESRDVDIRFDGEGGRLAHFQVPIIEVASLFINDCATALNSDEFVAYTGRGGTEPDDRNNPKIALKGQRTNIFDRGASQSVFERGAQNQRLVGKMGYTEQDGSTPALIKLALLTLVVKNYKVAVPGGGGGATVTPGVVKSELTDGHQIVYGLSEEYVNKVLQSQPTVGDILAMYRAPMQVGVTGVSMPLAAPGWRG